MKKKDFVVENLLSRIYQNKYEAGGKLPTERLLASHYQVSRYTIREALKKLIKIGIVTAVQGSGLFVSEDYYKNPLIYNSLTENKFKEIKSELIYFKRIKPDNVLKEIFDIRGNEELWEFKRVRIVDYRKVQIEVSNLPCSYFEDLSEDDIKNSVHSYVYGKKYKISHFITTYSPVVLSKEDAAILNCKKGIPAMKIVNRGVLENSKVFEYSEMINLDYSVSYMSPFNASNLQYRQSK
ncbi:GntR family transcriptional regulator [Clostridium sp. CF012]|uniref:GntR family transcriptional regulator n=1 Tax=Clostridium sp. CF012 TaxID=2843319 RepID=UPI001C0B7C16|nr:GntR family transcriptional regulator [Clostridium sp. CF012]MBU3143079.1 GntR family transcriptional regulator [Clostridium sp. CF012]